MATLKVKFTYRNYYWDGGEKLPIYKFLMGLKLLTGAGNVKTTPPREINHGPNGVAVSIFHPAIVSMQMCICCSKKNY